MPVLVTYRPLQAVQIRGSSLSFVQALEMFYMRMLFFTCTGLVPGVTTGPPCLTKGKAPSHHAKESRKGHGAL